MKILIVGGVAAGASAATKARRTNENAEIVIFEKGEYVSFANCGLPYYVGGDVAKKDDLLLVTPKLFKTRFNIDVRLKHEVLAIHPEKKAILVKNEDGEYEENYDKLILAMGCAPVVPPVPGVELEGVCTVATVNDVEKIAAVVDSGISSAVVVGGGFIGIETTEALLKRGIKTTLVEMAPQLLSNFDAEMTTPVERQLKRLGAKLILKKAITDIKGETSVENVELSDGKVIPAQLVIMSAGMKPRTALAREAGIAIGENGGIITNAAMETSIADIYAAGDIVEFKNLASGLSAMNPLAGSANKQGRVAGCCAAGGGVEYLGAQGTSIVRAGEITIAKTGLSEAEARRLGFDYYVTYNPVRNHAIFFPDQQYMIIKTIALKEDGKIIGAQVVGREGADKRIDVFATAIYAGLTVYDLENLDLAYAPPYSSARDPVLMAGMTAANQHRGHIRCMTVAQLKEIIKDESYQIVDVRREDEFLCGAVRGAKNIPVDEMRDRYAELDKSKKIVLYCGEGYRSYVASRFLEQMGYYTINLNGGYRTYTMDV